MPLLFKSTQPTDNLPYCHGTIEVEDFEKAPYSLQFTLIATSAATADIAVRNLAIALENLTNLKIKSVESIIVWDKIEGDNPIPEYGNQRENQGIVKAMMPSQATILVPIPNPRVEVLDPQNRKFLNLSHPDMAAFLAHLKSGKILVKGQTPLFYLGGFIKHAASNKGVMTVK